jgi:hypothetical protein
MKKILKLPLKILAGLIGLILIAAILIPVFFKDDIRKAIDDQLAQNLNAKVYYDADAFSLSLIRSFPNLSVKMEDFGIVGKGIFEKDTLTSVKSFELTLDVMSLFGDIVVNKIQLDQPRIFVMVMEDGTANYDITIPSEEGDEETEEGESAPMRISIDRWEITNGELIYYDLSLPFYVYLKGLDHSGSGDFEADVFDMVTETSVASFSLGYDGTEYMTNKSVTAQVTMAMDMANMKFTFKENKVAVNDFAFGFDGYVSMPGDDIEMDINYKGQEIDMKSVLSLIPGAYEEYLDGINASGEIAFEGFVKGIYNDSLMPAVRTNLTIKNGKVNTPDLPQALEKINVTMQMDVPSADLRQFNMILDYSSELAGQITTLKLKFKDLEDYQWDVDFAAKLDMVKLAKILPLAGSELKGNMNARLLTKGRMSDVDAQRWEKLPTSGEFQANDFYFKGPDLPQGFGMSKVDADFDPAKIQLTTFQASAGVSDFSLAGKLTNYLAFALGKDEKLVGNLDFNSTKLDLNEWMTEEVATEEEAVDTSAMTIVRIPVNVDFVLASDIKEILYTNLTLKDFNGKLIVRDGSVIIDKSGFNLLNGRFTMSGEYASAPEVPTFNFDFGIEKLSIPESFKAFTSIQKLVPIAEKTKGDFSTKFKANGALGTDMMPLLSSMSASGLVEIAEAALNNVKVLDGIKQIANIQGGETSKENLAQLKDVLLTMQIKDGRLNVQPFNLTIGGNQTVVSGSTGLDGSLDYAMAMKVPSGTAGQAVNQALSKYTLGNPAVSDFLDLTIGIGGTYTKPEVKLLGAKPSQGEKSLTASVKEQVQQRAEEKVTEVKKAVTDSVNAKIDTLKATATAEAKKAAEAAKKKAAEEAKTAVKDLFKKKN